MNRPFTTYSLNPPAFGAVPNTNTAMSNANATATPTPAGRGRGRGAVTGATGAKRARKPRGGAVMNTSSPRVSQASPGASSPVFSNYQYSHVHWATPGVGGVGQASNTTPTSTVASGAGAGPQAGGGNESGSLFQGNLTTSPTTSTNPASLGQQDQSQQSQPQTAPSSQQPTYLSHSSGSSVPGTSSNYSMPSGSSVPMLDTTGLISLTGSTPPVLPTGSAVAPAPAPARPAGADEDGEGDDELLPAMADDDYSAQLSWQSQSKDNLKCVQVACL